MDQLALLTVLESFSLYMFYPSLNRLGKTSKSELSLNLHVFDFFYEKNLSTGRKRGSSKVLFGK